MRQILIVLQDLVCLQVHLDSRQDITSLHRFASSVPPVQFRTFLRVLERFLSKDFESTIPYPRRRLRLALALIDQLGLPDLLAVGLPEPLVDLMLVHA